ncbi:hypothetical protein [Paenibacillus mesotrionivorans]|uniref:Uncharacterized protein n=1 Tax=Paenibacillus mesotrionivorans TaxID=3160968 RepID=A0ACC7NWA5_9BACL
MKVTVIGTTSRLVQLVRDIPGVQDVYYSNNSERQPADWVILDGVEYAPLEQILGTESGKIIYVYPARQGFDEPHYKRMREKCNLHQVPILTDLSDDQLTEEVERRLFPDRFVEQIQPSLALIGCHRNAGRKTIGRALARELATRTTGKVGFIDLDPYAYSLKEGTIWQLYREYEAGVLTVARIQESAILRDGVWEIGGNPKLDAARAFQPEKIEQLLRLVEQAFDVTIFSIAPYWDNSLTLVPLKIFPRQYLLATSQAAAMDEFYEVMSQLYFLTWLNLRERPFIFNYEGQGMEPKAAVASKLGAGAIASIPYSSRLQGNDDTQLIQSLLVRFTDVLISELQLPRKELLAAKKGFVQRLRGG